MFGFFPLILATKVGIILFTFQRTSLLFTILSFFFPVFGAPSNYLFPFRTESSKAAAVTIVLPQGIAKIAQGRDFLWIGDIIQAKKLAIMADVERIRRAIGEWKYFRAHPQEVGEELEAWVVAVVEGWKRGYEIAVVNDTEAELFEAGQAIDITSFSAQEIETQGRPSSVPESNWREAALLFLEGEAEKVATVGDLLWIEVTELSETGRAFFAFDVMEDEG